MLFTVYSLTSLIAFLSTLLSGCLVLGKSPESKVHRVYFLLNLSITIWVSGCFLESTVLSSQLNYWIDVYLYSGAVFAPTLFFHSILTFIKQEKNKLLSFFYGVSTVFLGVNFFGRAYFIPLVDHKISFRFIASPGPLWYVFILFFIGVTGYGLFLLFKERQLESGEQKRRLSHLFFAYVIVDLAAAFYLLLVFNIETPPIDNALVILYSITMAYAILKHRVLNIFLDAWEVFSLLIGKSMTLVFLLIIFSLLSFIYTFLFPFSDPTYGWGATMIFLVAAFEIYPWLKKRVQKIPDAVFVKRLYLYESVSLKLINTLERCVKASEIVSVLSQILEQDMKIPIQSLYLPKDLETSTEINPQFVKWNFSMDSYDYGQFLGSDDPILDACRQDLAVVTIPELSDTPLCVAMKTKGIYACIPFVSKHTVLGILLVKARPKQQSLSCDDLRFFDLLVPQIGIALDRLRAYSKVMAGFERTQKTASLMGLMNQYTHDIKAPMHVLSCLAQQESMTPDLKEEVMKQTARVSHLVKTMLDIANDKRHRKIEPVTLKEVLKSALEFYKITNATIQGDFLTQECPQIMGDFDDLLILFVNLIKNACEAMGVDKSDNCLTLMIGYDKQGHHVSVQVEDNGPGMSPEKVLRLWHLTDSDKEGGSGVGLAAVKRIIEEHQALVQVESKLGMGTRFTLKFKAI